MPEYQLNRGINKPVEFQGLVGSNIYYAVGGAMLVFALFVTLYMIGAPAFISVVVALAAATGMWFVIFGLNKKYGEFGLMKARARRSSPHYITNRQSRLFLNLKEKKADSH